MITPEAIRIAMILSATQAFGWLYINGGIVYLLFGSKGSQSGFDILTPLIALATAMLWCTVSCHFVSKRLMGCSSVAGFFGTVLALPSTLVLIAMTEFQCNGYTASTGCSVRELYLNALTFGFGRGSHAGNESMYGLFFFLMMGMSFMGFYLTAKRSGSALSA